VLHLSSKGKSGELASQSRKKDLNKIKCYICHKHDHCALECSYKKKGKWKQQEK
jgi:hypothetical protein